MLCKSFFKIQYNNNWSRMTSFKICAGDVFLIIYFLICTFPADGYCDNNFNKNNKETFKARVFTPRLIDALTEHNRNLKENQIDFAYLTSVDQESIIKNYTAKANDGRNNIECRCNTTKLSSKSTAIGDCNLCINIENENRERDDGNNKLFQLNYTQNKVNETIYLNVNFENLTDRQRRDVIDESSTSTNGLHGKWC